MGQAREPVTAARRDPNDGFGLSLPVEACDRSAGRTLAAGCSLAEKFIELRKVEPAGIHRMPPARVSGVANTNLEEASTSTEIKAAMARSPPTGCVGSGFFSTCRSQQPSGAKLQ